MRVAVEALEAVACVRAGRRRCAACERALPLRPTPLSRTSSHSASPSRRERDLDVSPGRSRRHTVLDGVLDERLQDQPRHLGVERLGIDVVAHRQAILESGLLDLQILLQELELLLQRDARRAAAVERQSQQIAQAADHPVGRVRVGVDQRRDRVQRVEQEMRVQFRLERLQPRLRQLRFELRLLHCARLRLAVVAERIARRRRSSIRHQRPVEVGQVDALHGDASSRRSSDLAGDRPEQQAHAEHGRRRGRRRRRARRRCGRERAQPARRVEREPAPSQKIGASAPPGRTSSARFSTSRLPTSIVHLPA